MVSLRDTLARAGDAVLNELLSNSVQQTLQVLQEGALTYERKIDLILEAHTAAGLLRNKIHRKRLIDQLTRDQAEKLATMMQLDWTGTPFPPLQNASILKGSDREKALFLFFEADVPPEEVAHVVPDQTSVIPMHGLFEHQRNALRKTVCFLESPQPRAFLHMPTGSGKTRTSMNLIARRLMGQSGALVLWLAYNEELCEQAAREFERTWTHVGDRELQVHRFYGSHKWNPPAEGIVIAGLGKLWSLAKENETALANIARQVDTIVFDEAHQSIADTYQLMVGIILAANPYCRLLGLSATPGRTWNDPAKDEELAALYHHQKVALEVAGYESPVDYLVDEGYLSKPDFHQLNISSGALTDFEIERAARETEYPAAVLRKLGANQLRNVQIAKKVKDLINAGHTRILLFATDVTHSEEIAQLLSGDGIAASSITGETPREVRRQRIGDYLADLPNPIVLCNFGVLTTGFDAPKTSAAIIARPTKSLVLYSQMAGRAIRGERVGGTANAEIWTVVDSQLPGFGNLSDAFWNWEDVW